MTVTYQRGSGAAALARRPTIVEAKRRIREHGTREQRVELERLERSSQSTSSRHATSEERRTWRLEKRTANAAAIVALAALVRP